MKTRLFLLSLECLLITTFLSATHQPIQAQPIKLFLIQQTGSTPSQKTSGSSSLSNRIVQETLLRSLSKARTESSADEKREESRVSEIAKKLALEKAVTSYLLQITQNFGQSIDKLDREAQDIKMKNGFRLNLKVRGQLIRLQQERVKLVQATMNLLYSKINEDSRKKVETYLVDEVRPNLKLIFGTEMLEDQRSDGRIQGAVYRYDATVAAMENLEVYGWGIVIEDYLIAGNDYRLTCNNERREGVLSSKASTEFLPAPVRVTAVTSLHQDGKYYDGTFTTTCKVETQGAIIR